MKFSNLIWASLPFAVFGILGFHTLAYISLGAGAVILYYKNQDHDRI